MKHPFNFAKVGRSFDLASEIHTFPAHPTPLAPEGRASENPSGSSLLKEEVARWPLVGAIAGDVIGSLFEHHNTKSLDFPLFRQHSHFTDDTVLTVATADALLRGENYGSAYRRWFNRHPRCGYGKEFRNWGWSYNAGPYGSFGNGSAMRASPIGWVFETLSEVQEVAKRSAEVTHNHPEGIKGAQAVASAVFLARKKFGKNEIRNTIREQFGYNLNRTIENIRPIYTHNLSCQGTVPEAIIAFLDSVDFEDAIRKAVSIGGDSDTIACITGSIAEAYYGEVPAYITDEVFRRLSPDLRAVVDAFGTNYFVTGHWAGNEPASTDSDRSEAGGDR